MRLIEEAVYVLVLAAVTVVAVFVIALAVSGVLEVVGGRGQDSNTSGSTREWRPPVEGVVLPVDSSPALVPAPSDRAEGETVVGGLGSLAEKLAGLTAETEVRILPEPASTVTQSALTGEGGTSTQWDINPATGMPSRPTVTVSPTDGGAYIAPATPVATAPPVVTRAPQTVTSYAPWPEYLWPTVACLIHRESRGVATAVGAAGERGWMQIGPANFAYLAQRGITPDSLFDPATNLRAGWLLYLWWQGVNEDGLTPWASTRGGCA